MPLTEQTKEKQTKSVNINSYYIWLVIPDNWALSSFSWCQQHILVDSFASFHLV